MEPAVNAQPGGVDWGEARGVGRGVDVEERPDELATGPFAPTVCAPVHAPVEGNCGSEWAIPTSPFRPSGKGVTGCWQRPFPEKMFPSPRPCCLPGSLAGTTISGKKTIRWFSSSFGSRFKYENDETYTFPVAGWQVIVLDCGPVRGDG